MTINHQHRGVFMRRGLGAALLLAGVAVAPVASAQTATGGVEVRVDRLEREMRAVQRKVFPGGAGVTLEPQISAPETTAVSPGSPSGGALTDLTARVSALENGVRSVTGQVEQASYRIRQLEEAFAAYRTATDARLKTLENVGIVEGGAAPTPGATAAVGNTAPVRPATGTSPPATRPTTRPTTPAANTAADPERVAAVEAIDKPSTGDAAEDGYTYGFRLWTAKLYPEAAAALKPVADKFPKHRRASFAQNLLGRSYLDDGKPSLASLAFYDSYKKFPDGERAPDSLFYLAKSLVVLKKPAADVCKVYGELIDVYGTKISASMKADVEKGRAAQKCK